MNNKNNRSSRRTRALLYSCFITLAEQKPVRSITVAELVDMSNISRSTFYTHFHDVYELMDSIGDELIDECNRLFHEAKVTHTPKPEDPTVNPMLDALCGYIHRNARSFSVMLSENGSHKFQRDLQRVIEAGVMESMRDLYGAMPKEYVMDFQTYVSSGCIGLVRAWVQEDPLTEPDIMARRFGLMIKGSASFLTSR